MINQLGIVLGNSTENFGGQVKMIQKFYDNIMDEEVQLLAVSTKRQNYKNNH